MEPPAGNVTSRLNTDWVVVGQYANGVDADLAVTLLEGHGIPVTLDNREFVGMDWMLANATGGIKVIVPRGHAIEAMKVLRGFAAKRRGGDIRLGEGDALTDTETCLRCGGPLPFGDAVCDACGWTFTEELEASSAVVAGAGAEPSPDGWHEEPDSPEARFERGAGVLLQGVLVGAACVVLIMLVMTLAQWALDEGWW